LRHFPPLP